MYVVIHLVPRSCGFIALLLLAMQPCEVGATTYRVDRLTTFGLNWDPSINNNGDIVYTKVIEGIYSINSLHDGPLTTDDRWKRHPKINDQGTIVWIQDVEAFDSSAPNEVYLRENGQVSLLIGGDGHTRFGADINNRDQILWSQQDPDGVNIYRSNLDEIVPELIAGGRDPGAPAWFGASLNDNGEFVYRVVELDAFDHPVGNGELHRGVFSNFRGYLVEPEQLEFFGDPVLSNTGELAWYARDENGLYQVFHLLPGGEPEPVSHAAKIDCTATEPDCREGARWLGLNDHGVVVWTQKDGVGNWNIYRATPVPDRDDDGIPDAIDEFPDDPERFVGGRFVAVRYVAVGQAADIQVSQDGLAADATEAERALVGTRLVVPASEFAEDVVLTLKAGSIARGSRLNAPFGQWTTLGAAVEFGPDGTTLGGASRLTLPYDPALLAQVLFGSTRVARIDGDGTVRILLPTQVDPFGIVTVSPGHFSQFVVVGQSLSTSGGGGGCVAARREARKGGGVAAALLLVAPLAVASCSRRRVARG